MLNQPICTRFTGATGGSPRSPLSPISANGSYGATSGFNGPGPSSAQRGISITSPSKSTLRALEWPETSANISVLKVSTDSKITFRLLKSPQTSVNEFTSWRLHPFGVEEYIVLHVRAFYCQLVKSLEMFHILTLVHVIKM